MKKGECRNLMTSINPLYKLGSLFFLSQCSGMSRRYSRREELEIFDKNDENNVGEKVQIQDEIVEIMHF